MQPGGIHTGGLPITVDDVRKAQIRHGQARTPIPEVGDVVWYRHDSFGPLVEATVTAVAMEFTNPPDPNVWHRVTEGGRPVNGPDGHPLWEIGPDPWPVVTLEVADRRQPVATREARVTGSPGWLPRSSS